MRPRKAQFFIQDHTARLWIKKHLAPESVLLTTMLCCLPFSICKKNETLYNLDIIVIIHKGLMAYQMNSLTWWPWHWASPTFSANRLPPTPSSKAAPAPRPLLVPLHLKLLRQPLLLSSPHLLLLGGPAPIRLPTALWASAIFLTSSYHCSLYFLLTFPGYPEIL